jgi:hypothetical protein
MTAVLVGALLVAGLAVPRIEARSHVAAGSSAFLADTHSEDIAFSLPGHPERGPELSGKERQSLAPPAKASSGQISGVRVPAFDFVCDRLLPFLHTALPARASPSPL